MALAISGSAPARPNVATTEPGVAGPDEALLARPGTLLRQAVDALEGGRPEQAETLLEALSRHHAVIADYADLLRMRLLVEAGRYDDAIALRSQWRYPDSPLGAEFHQLLGQAYAARGDAGVARAAWELALGESPDEERAAELRLALARSYLDADEPERAVAAFLEIWTQHPLSEAEEEAGVALVLLEKKLGRTLRDASAYRRRGDELFRLRRNEEALAAYDRAIAMGELDAADARRAHRKRADTLFRLRRYPAAIGAFGQLPPTIEVRIDRARAMARAGDSRAAPIELERIARDASGREAARAKYLAALLWEDDEPARSRRLFTELVDHSPNTSYGEASRWRLGWAAYRKGRLEEAMAHFAKLSEQAQDPISALRARYWHARTAERAGRDGTVAAFAAIAREFPFSYYGWRSLARAKPVAGEAGPVKIARGRAVLAPGDLARPRLLIEAGLHAEARAELDRLFVRARGLDDRLALAGLYADAGDFHRPERLMVDAYQVDLARGPAGGPVELWQHAWPLPFREAVRESTLRRTGLEPELVYAIMREESGYRPEVLSVSGARGLLQLMPETAERVAARLEMADFSAEDLFLPEINIELGSAYLADLLHRFSGRESAAVGSYNAGPHRVTRWLGGKRREDDEWVEDIPFEETRGYVKRVLRSMHAYRVLY